MTTSIWPSNILRLRRLAATGTRVVLLSIFVATFFVTGASAATHEIVLHDFGYGSDGASSHAGLISDAAGNFYGTMSGGGAYGQGVAFEVTNSHGGWIEKRLHEFGHGADGSAPFAGLIMDTAGNLYGTTSGGGTYSYGTVFELTPDGHGGWTEKILHSFDFRNGDGTYPGGGVIFDSSGNLYGTTGEGGNARCNPPNGCGIIFKLKAQPDGDWTEKVLLTFEGTNGSSPNASLLFDTAGNLYGTTLFGGDTGNGTVFELTPGGDGEWTEKVLHNFTNTDGAEPYASVIFDGAGDLYGTTVYGGTYSEGTVFELKPEHDGNWTEHVLHSFKEPGAGGAFPYGGLIGDANGNLYGTTTWGGVYSEGTVFELRLEGDGSWTETALYGFQGLNGTNPGASMIFGSPGHLYGTTEAGGVYGGGTVFELFY